MKHSTPRMKQLAYVLFALFVPILTASNLLLQQVQTDCIPPEAGEDHIYCQLPSTVPLTATPLGNDETGSWSQLKGQTAIIAQPSSPNTLINGLQANGGPYHFAWTVNRPDCSRVDTVKIAERPSWAFRELQDLPCTDSFNVEEDFLLDTEPVTLEAVGEFTISLTFLAVPEGIQRIAVQPLITVSTPSDSSRASFIPDIFYDGSTSDTAQLGIPLSYNITTNLLSDQLPNSLLSHENISLALLFDKYQARGKYKYSVSISNECSSTSFERFYINSGFSILTPDAGPDIYLNCNEISSSLNGTGLYYPSELATNRIHAGRWYTVASPGPDPLDENNRYEANPSLDNLVQGVYTFRYMARLGAECPSIYDDVNVHVNNSAPTGVNAYLDQAAVCATGPAQLVAEKGNSTGTGTWVQISPAVTIEQMRFGTSPDTVNILNLLSDTDYTIQYYNNNSCGISSATVTFRTGKHVGPTMANIPLGFICTAKDSLDLEADPVTFGYGSWSLISGPIAATPVFSDPNSHKTTISGMTEDGVYVVKFTTFTIPCYVPSGDYITLVKGEAPLLDAGSDILDCQASFPKTLNMAAAAPTNGTAHWSFLAGPSVPYFSDPTAYNTAVTFSQPGSYVLEWISTYADCSHVSDQVEVRLGVGTTTADAGPDQEMCGGNGSFTLDALDLATDENGVWTVVSTTGNVSATFADNLDPNTAVSLSNSGEAVLRWTTYGLNNACHESDEVDLKWTASATTADDITLCNASSTELMGNSYEEMLDVELSWTFISGPNMPVIATATEASTIVSNLTLGDYVFNYSVSVGTCSSNANMTVSVVEPDIAWAGRNQELCGEDTILLSGSPSGTATPLWTLLEGPDTGSFSNINGNSTAYGPVQEGAMYEFAYSLDNGGCVTHDYLSVSVQSEMQLDLIADSPCGGSTATITTDVTASGYTGGYSYLWSNGATTEDITVATESVSPYAVTVTAVGYCPAVNQITIETCLPVTLGYFKAEEETCRVRIFWESLEEINLAYYEVEKSNDGFEFNTLGRLEAKGGGQARQYEIWDEEAQSLNYYRLKIINSDLSYEYFRFQIPVATDCYKDVYGITDLYPNPTSGEQLHLKYFHLKDELVYIEIMDLIGRQVGSEVLQVSAGGDILDINIAKLPTGVYFVWLYGTDWETLPQKFVKID